MFQIEAATAVTHVRHQHVRRVVPPAATHVKSVRATATLQSRSVGCTTHQSMKAWAKKRYAVTCGGCHTDVEFATETCAPTRKLHAPVPGNGAARGLVANGVGEVDAARSWRSAQAPCSAAEGIRPYR